ncbi:MAG: DUF3972 domain-containing protein [Sulfurospirillaceae bacterium]|jgi:hypothetical protein|nr:DUF3972 domain-containing protein [Sulfurospirillaceae bacterium]MCK9545402.1 DUF3972 domain-containing protein [Sulfurospirillaceae bacterium]MDY0237578.1 DUF3972 domain-containing protein [Campylobacterales bacterium]NLM99961.1 DUF3972 domain-containing protein [Campylobacteraceae bacterium]
MQAWLKVDEFCKLAHLDLKSVESLIKSGELKTKEEDGELFVETTTRALGIVPKGGDLTKSNTPSGDFVEKTIGTILNLHEKVLDAKDETLEALKSENRFLKEALFSMQELYDEDRKTVETLSEQLKYAREEIEFLKRKYKLMWNQAVENYKKES